ncbi:MAG: outer membrane beta-barrel protein [Bacteroidetes bacterium]|nr:outer membrane beta-barrel protein [Bacteroidota bacterium]
MAVSFGKKIVPLFLCYSLSVAAQDSTKINHATENYATFDSTRAPASPLPSGPFPSTDWCNTPIIGIPTDAPDFALQKLLHMANNKSRIKIYGWVDPSYTWSTSKSTTVPVSYNIIPNSLQLSQTVIRIERQPNTVQTDHIDWGFRLSNVYGLDYRYTVAKGWFSNQYFKHNNLYGYDCPEAYFMLYFPKVVKGMILKIGRYIAPADIEAQLTTDNYLYTHSVMFSYDAYTFTGLNATIKLTRQSQLMLGIQGGNDNAPWTNSFNINGQIMYRWVSKTNNDGLWFGISSLGPNPTYKVNHDDIQQVNAVWGHKFGKRLHMQTEAYYIWEKNAAQGGSASNGPVRYDAGGGPGPIMPGISQAIGAVNYFQILTSKKSYLCIRTDYLNDMNGWRTGFATNFWSETMGFIYQFTNWLMLRPEIRYDRTFGSYVNNQYFSTPVYAYDANNPHGAKKDQVTFSMDMIVRF